MKILSFFLNVETKHPLFFQYTVYNKYIVNARYKHMLHGPKTSAATDIFWEHCF